jgi:hypothetical protein
MRQLSYESVTRLSGIIRVVSSKDIVAGVDEQKPAQNGGMICHFEHEAQRVCNPIQSNPIQTTQERAIVS